MMPCRIDAEQLVVECVRQPRKRMPVCLLGSGEGPGNGGRTQASADVWVVFDIAIVIVVGEGMLIDRVVDCQRHYHDQQAKNDAPLLRRFKQERSRLGFMRRQYGDLTTVFSGGAEES